MFNNVSCDFLVNNQHCIKHDTVSCGFSMIMVLKHFNVIEVKNVPIKD